MPRASSAKSDYGQSGATTDIPQVAAGWKDRLRHCCCKDKPEPSRQGRANPMLIPGSQPRISVIRARTSPAS